MTSAIAILSEDKGYVLFEQLRHNKTRITFFLEGFGPRATHAIHIHEYGDVSKGCDSLGGHYNPTGQRHGSINSKHRHKGDLINNFETNNCGAFVFSYIDDLDVSDLFGRSVVIHELADDLGLADYSDLYIDELKKLCRERGYKVSSREAMISTLNRESRVTGNAGRRISCGVIGRRRNI